MTNIKTQFSQMRSHVPKRTQWLLLIAGFVVVLILITLLLSPSKKQDIKKLDSVVPVLTVTPDSIDWTSTTVGENKKQEFSVSSNVPVKIDSVRLSKDKAGLSKPKTTCTNIGQITDKISCTINIEYKPTTKDNISAVPLFVDWRAANQPENMNKTEKVIIAAGASEKKVEKIKEPEITKKITESKNDNLVKDADEKKDIDKNTLKQDSSDLKKVSSNKKNPVSRQTNKKISEPTKSESCSDFAFPGYNTSGRQAGWIKPESGTYKFHPFSDKNCDTPTGIYNPDTGLIVDITDPSKRLGTDAQHIGYSNITTSKIPKLSNPITPKKVNRATQLSIADLMPSGSAKHVFSAPIADTSMRPSSYDKQATVSSRPYDRTFVLRQYKPIPATIVSEIRAVPNETKLPVTATVDRNVYSDNGRTIIIPAGTMILGAVSDQDLPGPYKSIGRVGIEWYRFVRPDGVEFNFNGGKPFSADAQGRTGVPGRGSTDYMEQFIMPMLTAIVPAAVNMIAPISDQFVNQIDLDSNTVTTSGQVKSSELAKNEIISTWNTVAQKLLVDTMDNTVPPFSIAAGTRITVFSPNDLIVTCGEGTGKKCSIAPYATEYAETKPSTFTVGVSEPETLVGQVRSFNLDQYCDKNGGVTTGSETAIADAGLDYRTVAFYCSSSQYQAKNNAKQDAVYTNQKQTSLTTKDSEGNVSKLKKGTQSYNEQVLGLNYNEDGAIDNPFGGGEKAPEEISTLTCDGGISPDGNGCCPGETFDTEITNPDTGQPGVCCPDSGGDCFPPII